MSLYNKYNETIKKELKEKMGLKNILQVPKVDKVIVSMGIGSLATRKGMKDFSVLESNLIKITGQKPRLIKSKRAISNFKLREDMPVMLKVTLRRQKAYDFIERLTSLAFPRVRDFAGVNPKSFDGKGNLNLGFLNQTVFSELNPEEITLPHGLQVTVVTSADKDDQAKQLLEELGVIFIKK